MSLLINLIIAALVVMAAAYIVPGVIVDTFATSLVVALVLGVLNTFIKPILILLTLPINILTLGLFTLIINVFLIYLASAIIPGFEVRGFVPALIFSLVMALFSAILNR